MSNRYLWSTYCALGTGMDAGVETEKQTGQGEGHLQCGCRKTDPCEISCLMTELLSFG